MSAPPGGMRPTGPTLERFAAIVGERYAILHENEMAAYLHEWRDRYIGRAAMVLRPGSTAEVSAILALAQETGTAIVPQGGNTGLVGGQIPFETGHEIVLSLSRLNRIRGIDAAGGAITVEAGVTLAAVQREAEAANRLFPLSLGSEGSCQIGGNLATNAGGMQVLAYGSARELTLGVEAVLPGGDIIHGLKALRKDNTGYDLKNLLIGSEGTLAIITAATLRLFPRPKEQASVFAGFESLAAAAQFFDEAQTSAGPSLTLFEIMPRIGLEMTVKHMGGRDPLAAPYPWYALMEISSHETGGRAEGLASEIAGRGLETGAVADAALASSLAEAQELRRLREAMSEAQKFEGGSIKHDVSVPVAKIPAFIEEASAAAERVVPGARPVAFGHFGDGNIHFNVSQPEGAEREAFLARWEEVAEAVHAVATAMGGSISAEHGVGRMKKALLPGVKCPAEMAMMRRIKAAFDPTGILNPGKLL